MKRLLVTLGLCSAACIVVLVLVSRSGDDLLPDPLQAGGSERPSLPRPSSSVPAEPAQGPGAAAATTAMADIPEGSEAVDDVEGSGRASVNGNDALPAGSSKQTWPRTPAERSTFLKVYYWPLASNLGGAEYAAEIRDGLLEKLRADLRPEEMLAATQAIDGAVLADQRFKMARADAIADYITNAPDLGTPRPQGKRQGCSGMVSAGIEPEWARYWGNAESLMVRYFLAFDDYPELGVAHAERARMRRVLKPYSK